MTAQLALGTYRCRAIPEAAVPAGYFTAATGADAVNERLDLVLLHNPERAHPGDRLALRRAIREAFVVLEEAVAAGHVAGYGIATWAGLEEEAFTVGELLALAAEVADGAEHHLVAVQMPVSLVMMTPIAQVLHGRAAHERGQACSPSPRCRFRYRAGECLRLGSNRKSGQSRF
ncbi:hypothetical protein ACFWWT_39765 [Streptomyces sp. NPDC058676]|uniref:hypothetical protein n=1 Tax=unclassified Streptomyces TaxID=2593676 RepID=UPI00365F6E2B